ncbi:MAG: GGDEF domain-containing protein [Bacilli bacterium]|nr:GGDEF domain-containing protein [Bacilli bacterium]
MTNQDKNKKNNLFHEIGLLFFPSRALKRFNISKEDFKRVQVNTSKRMGFLSFVGSIFGIVMGLFLVIFTFNKGWGDRGINIYIYSAVFSLFIGSLVSCILLAFPLFSHKDYKWATGIGDSLFHASIALTICFFYVADIFNGELSTTHSVSTSLLLIPLLILCQPGYWQISVIFNALFAFAGFGLVTYGHIFFQTSATLELILLCLFYLVACYCTYSAYTYVECQRYYIENKNTELLSRSIHDPLTGARNRNGLRLYLEDHLTLWKKNNEKVLVIMCDIDDFKLYNDEFGHLNGDSVLKTLVETLNNAKDLHHFHVFRYGGEEFLILISHAQESEAFTIMEMFRKSISDLNIKAPERAPYPILTISLGGALWAVKEDYTFHNHVQDADTALYEAKKGLKNKSILHTKYIQD